MSAERFKWRVLPTLSEPKIYSTLIELDGVLYAVGGANKLGQPISHFESYNIASKSWSILPALSLSRAGATVLTLDRNIFVLSGVTENQVPLAETEKFDSIKQELTSIKPMPAPLLGTSAVVKDNRIYSVGGMGLDTNPVDLLLCYDATRNMWISLRKMPTARYATFSFNVDGQLYVCGGRAGKSPLTDFARYDLRTSQWSPLDPIPEEKGKRVFPHVVQSANSIVHLGGLEGEHAFSSAVEIYDITAGKWRAGAPMKQARADFSACTFHDGTIVAVGGLGESKQGAGAGCESYDISTDTWTEISDSPTPHACAASALVTSSNQQSFFVHGGLSSKGPAKRFECLVDSKVIENGGDAADGIGMDRE